MSKELVELIKSKDLVVPANELFVAAVDKKWFNKILRKSSNDTDDAVMFGLFGGAGVGTVSVLFVDSLNLVNGDNLAFVLPYIGVVAIASAVGSRFQKRKTAKKNRESVSSVVSVNEKVFTDWLQARYGISITSDVAEYLTQAILMGRGNEHHPVCWFKDVNEKPFKLNVNSHGEYFVTEDPVEDYVATVVVEKVETSSFTGEAATLSDSIVSRLDKLRKRDLNVEANHIVSRVANDLKQVLDLHEDLVSLGETNMGKVVNILSALNSELNDLMVIEIAAVNNQLSVQEEYLKERQSKNTVSENLSLGSLSTQSLETPTGISESAAEKAG